MLKQDGWKPERRALRRHLAHGRGSGWGTWIRTKTNRVRVCCATVTPFPNGLPSVVNSLYGYPDKSHKAGQNQISARWWGRSTRLILPLASTEAGAIFARDCLARPDGVVLEQSQTAVAVPGYFRHRLHRDECADELLRHGVALVSPPTDQSFGHRTLFFRDPDGNLLEVYAEI